MHDPPLEPSAAVYFTCGQEVRAFRCAYKFLPVQTPTPPTPTELARAEFHAYFWLAFTMLAFMASIISLVFAISGDRPKVRVGFDVAPPPAFR